MDIIYEKKKWLTAFILAIAVRSIFVWFFPQPVQKDAAVYDQLGKNLAMTGQMYPGGSYDSKEVLSRTPIYPVFLSLIYKFAGHSFQTVRMIQLLIDIVSCLIVFYLTRFLGFSNSVSFIAFGLMVINPFTSAYTSALLAENLGIFLMILSFFLFFLAFKKRQVLFFILTGIMFGILTLSRPQFVLLLPLIFVLLVFIWLKKDKTNRILYSILIALVLLVPYLAQWGLWIYARDYISSYFFIVISPVLLLIWFFIPNNTNNIKHEFPDRKIIIGILGAVILNILVVMTWTYRNYLVTGRFIPLVVSYSPGSVGYYLVTLPIPWGKDPMEVDDRWQKFLKSSGEEKEKLEKEMRDIGYQRLITKPYFYAWLCLRRFIRLWNQGNLLYFYTEPRWVWVIFTFINLIYYFFAWLGVWITRRNWRLLVPLYVPFIYLAILGAPSHVESRYSIETFPIICLFGGMGLNYLWNRHKRGKFLPEELIPKI